MFAFVGQRVIDMCIRAGHKSYLVGGSVRDLLVKQTPKDFDILTTAEPKQVGCAKLLFGDLLTI